MICRDPRTPEFQKCRWCSCASLAAEDERNLTVVWKLKWEKDKKKNKKRAQKRKIRRFSLFCPDIVTTTVDYLQVGGVRGHRTQPGLRGRAVPPACCCLCRRPTMQRCKTSWSSLIPRSCLISFLKNLSIFSQRHRFLQGFVCRVFSDIGSLWRIDLTSVLFAFTW